MAKLIQASPLINAANTLGEGPFWHSSKKMLFWVDIEKKIVHGYDPKSQRHQKWNTPQRVGTVASAANGNLILGLQEEIAEMDLATGRVKTLLKLEADLPGNRCNDGKCDPAGRFWVGTMELETKPGTGSLYCVDSQLNAHKVLTGLTIANGMGWSPKGDFMYFIDSADYCVRRYWFSPDKPVLEKAETILKFANEMPDGMCVDSEGMLWIGFWGGSRVGRYNPDNGNHLAEIKIPAPHVTSCCFGGEDLTKLYVTTARAGLSDEQLKHFPLSGSLFVCEPGVSGVGATDFRF